MYLLIAFISGGLTILSMIVNSKLAKYIGIIEGTMVNYIVGLFFSFLIILVNKDIFNISISMLNNVPFWCLFGGAVGVIVVSISNIIMPKIPTIYTTLLIFSGQILFGLVIDFFLIKNVGIGKIIGSILVIVGLTYSILIDYKKNKIKIEQASKQYNLSK
ncbi:DMT family transporter [Helicovermis profundi]|uniref:DMT family transporter n=1 Tax=Helicovermis profundi TaxID=3065157 RepID=A0AAU9E217_9FIRM|nr:DMT family transporter [Clostridia bacterium S502]